MTDKEQGGGEKPFLRRVQFPESCSIPWCDGRVAGSARAPHLCQALASCRAARNIRRHSLVFQMSFTLASYN